MFEDVAVEDRVTGQDDAGLPDFQPIKAVWKYLHIVQFEFHLECAVDYYLLVSHLNHYSCLVLFCFLFLLCFWILIAHLN